MAKYGEGDKRWIVEDRPDGTNVHNWHWAETNCLEYTRNFFTKSFTNSPIPHVDPTLSLSLSLDKLDGEAYVNIRKGKVIPGYEISLKLTFTAISNSQNTLNGSIEVPYISDENADEDPDFKLSFSQNESEFTKIVRDALMGKGKEFVLGKVREWVESMAKGGPVKDDLDAKKSVVGIKKKAESGVVEGKKQENEKDKRVVRKEGFKNIGLSERFRCRARDLFEIMMDENRWKGFTQSNAKISKEVGGDFSIFDGSVTGVNVELVEGKLIVQKWRFGSWPDGIQSTVRLVFDEPEPGVTVVNLTQTDVPEEDRYGNATVVENTERGWRDLIFSRIRGVFGFGM